MELTRQTAADRQVIQRYGGGRFRVSGVVHTGSILVTPAGTTAWPVAAAESLTVEAFAPLLAGGVCDVCLLGCGPRMVVVPPGIRAALKDAGIGIDAMDTGAACRTYNVLAGEGRHVAAALIAV